MMKATFPALRFRSAVVVGLMAAASIAAVLPAQTCLAQIDDRPLGEINGDSNADPFTRSQRGDGLGAFDLIHNAVLGGGQSQAEFLATQDEDLNNATNDFFKKRQQRLKQQRQSAGSIEFGEGVLPESGQ